MGGSGLLRLALVCPYDLAIPGGVQTQVASLAAELARRPDEIEMITVIAPGAVAVDEKAAPFRQCNLPAAVAFTPVGRSLRVPANGSRSPVALGPLSWPRTASALRRGRFDVVHVHEPMAPLVALAASATARSPLVGTFHRAGADAFYALEAKLLRRVAERIRTRVAVSDEARSTAEQVLRLEIPHILPNGVTVPDEPPAPKADVPTVLFLGRHEERKGLAVLLEASRMIGPDVRLLVANEGPQTEGLRRRYGSDRRIEWLGRVDEAAKPLLFSSAHLYCSPALGGESFGVVLLEAMAVGTAVVASDLPGYRRAAGDAGGESPVTFVPPGDPAALAAAIESLLRDPDRLASLASAGRRRAAELSICRLADAYLQLYRSAVAPID